MNGSGRNRGRRHGRHRERENYLAKPKNERGYDKNDGTLYERPRWTAPKPNTDPLPSPDCLYCGKPIKDIQSAIQDKQSGQPVHFDCIITRLGETENLDRGEVISYLGGGRFGIVRFGEGEGRPGEGKEFIIKRVIEWEDKENRADWRDSVADHYSVT